MSNAEQQAEIERLLQRAFDEALPIAERIEAAAASSMRLGALTSELIRLSTAWRVT